MSFTLSLYGQAASQQDEEELIARLSALIDLAATDGLVLNVIGGSFGGDFGSNAWATTLVDGELVRYDPEPQP